MSEKVKETTVHDEPEDLLGGSEEEEDDGEIEEEVEGESADEGRGSDNDNDSSQEASDEEATGEEDDEAQDEPMDDAEEAPTAADEAPEEETQDQDEGKESQDSEVGGSGTTDLGAAGASETDNNVTAKQDPSSAAEENRKQEAVYSTRGRAADGSMDPLERLAREALGDLTREKEPPSSLLRDSFLSDAITEEERRTRTRYIPEVDGMHGLRKHEIKGDLALARSIMVNANVAGSVAASKAKAKRGNTMDMDIDDGAASGEDERAAEVLRVGTKTILVGETELELPSTAFVAPSPETKSGKVTSPSEIEAVTAFNPPRPPESVGAKKKHRMLRWERNPADIEVDLNNYRKTVQRTREELKRAQEERERIESVDNHLRRHFLTHLQSLSEEWKRLSNDLASVQQECIASADLLTSRTRSRGAAKTSYAMRDALTVLRTRGQEIEAKGLSLANIPSLLTDPPTSGVGGVGQLAFEDWDRSTSIKPSKVASAWICPGDKVETPYGEGSVVAVFGPSALDAKEAPHKDLLFKRAEAKVPDAMEVDEKSPSKAKDDSEKQAEGKSSDKAHGQKKTETSKEDETARSPVLKPRVAVRLKFGLGFFPVGSVVSKEDPSTYSDARLAQRWKGLIETASAVGGYLDIEANAEYLDEVSVNESMGVDMDEGTGTGGEDSEKDKARLLPFGAGLLPTGNGRGADLWKLDLDSLDAVLDSTMFKGGGVLGKKDNKGVPKEIRKLEDDRQEYLVLKAQVLQLKNELYRQRKVRILNERAYAATQDRAARVEALVAEMRTDLKTLKRRLDEEVAELGIAEDEAEHILTSFYRSLDSKHRGEASPPKRPRRLSRMDEEVEDMEDDDDAGDEQAETGSMDMPTSEQPVATD